jgi:hypothetical protein
VKEEIRARINGVWSYVRARLNETTTHAGIAILLGGWAVRKGYDPMVVSLAVSTFCGALFVALPDKIL